MSGFSAIFQRDGRPLDVPVLQRMNEAICHRGPDGSGSWVEGPVGLAHQVLHATPDALRDTQPAVSARGTLVLVYEGLIDNGADIREAARTAAHPQEFPAPETRPAPVRNNSANAQ